MNDLIELMQCKNCKCWINGVCQERTDPNNSTLKLETPGNDHCSFWEEKIIKNEMQSIFHSLVTILKQFIDTKEENYYVISLWIMGTWTHDCFQTYPYLFINAMKGSGKTRLLKLIKELSWQGDMLASLSEAVLFRTTGTLCIDEFENVSGKEKNALRELLNTAYKRGGKVKRMRKKKTPDGEQQVVEEFNTFRPIVMANISGMDEIVGDRCISIILEKSNNSLVTRKIENFDTNKEIQSIKANLLKQKGVGVGVCSQGGYEEWNKYVDNHIDTLLHHTTLPTLTYTNLHLFDKIYQTNIDGRNLELSMPLLMISNQCEMLDKVIEIMKAIIQEKKEDDVIGGKDVGVIDIVSKQFSGEWIRIRQLVTQLAMEISYDSTESHWLRPEWMSACLKRLNLVKSKRRTKEGMEVMLDVEKAKLKLEIFK